MQAKLLLTAAMLCTGTIAHADTIDQSNTSVDNFFTGSYAAGQSFTPTLTGINFATFSLESQGPTSSVALELYQGAGFTGPLLGVSPLLDVTTYGTYEFLLFNIISLTPGDTYTLRLPVESGSNINEAISGADPYAGGTAYYSGGSAFSGADLGFSEGLTTAVTPEPSSFVLFATGLLGAFGAMKRRSVIRVSA